MIAPKKITVTIDGKSCEGTAGQTILEIATAHHIYIPTLCYLKHLSPWGGCRMCICEVAGSPKVVPACSTPAVDGAGYITNSDRLHHLRRATLELLFSERNHICPFCPMNKGDCELQQQGYRHGMESVRYPYLYPALPVDVSGRYFGLDHNRCILCTRCVRTCEEIEGVHTLDIGFRGERNRVVVDLNTTFGSSTSCTLCGACVVACPTGALFDKAQAFRGKLNTCHTVRTTCTECPLGCGLLVFTKENRIVEVFGDHESPVSHGHLCVKGRYETWAEPRPRITHPLLRRNGRLEPVRWDEALRFLRATRTGLATWQTGLLASARLTNETGAALRRLADHFDRIGFVVARNEAALCEAPDFAAGGLEAMQTADAFILIGVQPSRHHGVLAARVRTAVRRRGAKLLVFHCRKSDLDAYATIAANVVSVERAFWKKVGDALRDVKQPVLIYGPNAMTPIGVTVLERLIQIFEVKKTGQAPVQIPVPTSTNSFGLAAAGLMPVEDLAPWLDEKPLEYLHILAADEPDGGAHWLEERHVRALLGQIDCVVVQAAYRSALTDLAHVVLPAPTWFEKAGTITNFEGAALPLRQVIAPRDEVRHDQAVLEALFA